MGSVIYIPKRNILTPVKYGLLYNLNAATYSTGGASIAPSGWHVPTLTELSTLYSTLGGTSIAGTKSKEAGFIHWDSPNTGTNEVGFNGRGSGLRYGSDGVYISLKKNTYITASNYAYGGGRLSYDENDFTTASIGHTKGGFTIRLLKNDSTDPGTITDYDGNIYPTVKIGSQVWMAQNLMVTHFNDGTLIPWHGATPASYFTNAEWAALTTAGVCAYDNTLSNVATGFTFPI